MFKNLFDAVQKKRNANFIEENPSAILLHNLLKVPPHEKGDDMPSYFKTLYLISLINVTLYMYQRQWEDLNI